MGRGNYCPIGNFVYQWYIDYENYKVEDEDDDGKYDWYDYELLTEDIGSVMSRIEDRFTSFCHVDRYGHGEHARYWCEHIWLENEFFEIGTADNGWSQAIFIHEKNDVWPEHLNLAKKHFEEYKTGIQNILLDYFGTIGIRAGAWTSGTLTKEPVNA